MNPRTFSTAILTLLLAAPWAGAAPSAATRPSATTRPAAPAAAAATTQSAQSPEQQKRAKLQELTRKSILLLKDKKWDAAEETLVEALVLDPDQPTNIYNMACLKALTNRPADAVAYLERAVNAGFTDFLHIEQDADLAAVRDLPRYKALIAAKDAYQKKDADRALASLRKQLGDKYVYDVDPVTKLIFAANTDAQTLDDVKRWLTAQAKSQWDQLFEHRPDQYVAIFLPSAADYARIIRQPGVEGIYMHGARMLIAKRLGQVMTHEFTHALHAGDLDPLGQEHPIWIVEGLASLFEAGVFEGDKLVPRDNYRLEFLQKAQRFNRLVPLEKLFVWKQPQFVANANLGYGEASSVMLYLYEHQLLRPFYDAYKANFDKDPSGKQTLEKIAGKPLKEFENDWKAWMMKRTPPARDTGPDGPVIGVFFAQVPEKDGLRIERVLGKGPAESAGIKVGDVIVGMNDLDVRDQLSLMPLLKELKPGDGVVFKLRRGVDYLTLPVTLGRRDGGPPASKAPTTKPATATPKNAK